MTWVLWVHPILQIIATLMGLWVMEMGVRRFLFAHLKVKGIFFNWKRHVLLGKIVLVVWLLGLVVGVWAMHYAMGAYNVTGGHFNAALPIAGLAGIGYATGHVMDRDRKRRKILNLFHGINNTVLLALVFYQVWTGFELMNMFLFQGAF